MSEHGDSNNSDNSSKDKVSGESFSGQTTAPPEGGASGRGLHILQIILFAIIYQVCEVVWAFVSLFQGGALLLTGAPNTSVGAFAEGLTAYMSGLLRFISQQSAELPWPLGSENQGSPFP